MKVASIFVAPFVPEGYVCFLLGAKTTRPCVIGNLANCLAALSVIDVWQGQGLPSLVPFTDSPAVLSITILFVTVYNTACKACRIWVMCNQSPKPSSMKYHRMKVQLLIYWKMVWDLWWQGRGWLRMEQGDMSMVMVMSCLTMRSLNFILLLCMPIFIALISAFGEWCVLIYCIGTGQENRWTVGQYNWLCQS